MQDQTAAEMKPTLADELKSFADEYPQLADMIAWAAGYRDKFDPHGIGIVDIKSNQSRMQQKFNQCGRMN